MYPLPQDAINESSLGLALLRYTEATMTLFLRIDSHLIRGRHLLLSLCCLALGLSLSSSLFAKDESLRESTIEVGFEALSYDYRESTETISSNADMRSSRLALRFQKLGKVPFSFYGAWPLSSSRGGEHWYQSLGNTLFQINDLQERFRTLALYCHPLRRERRFIFGLRLDDLKQIRDNFSNAAGLIAHENVESKWLEFGYRFALGKVKKGRSPFDNKAQLTASIGYAFDVYLNNSALPGFEVNDSNGWLWRLEARLPQLGKVGITPRISYEYIHWDGTAWLPYGASQVRWPVNRTRTLGFGLSYRF